MGLDASDRDARGSGAGRDTNEHVIRHVSAFAFFLALAIALTWPLALHLDAAVPDFGDPLLNAWIVDWVCHALTHDPLHLFDAPIYHPAPNTLAFSEHMTGVALVALPFHLARLPALAVYNIALLLGFAFSGYGAFVLARVITRSTSAALIAGVIHGFASFKIAHVQHLQIVWSGWLPLLLAAILVYWREPRLRNAVFVGVVFVMNGLTNIHWLLFGGFALVMTIALLQFAQPRRGHWLRLIGALAIASLVLLPFLIPYQRAASEYRARRTTNQARLRQADPVHWIVGSSRNVLYGDLFEKWREDEKQLFPGVVAVVLAIVGLIASRPLTLALSPLRRARGLDFAIVVFGAITAVVAFAGRVSVGPLSFSGADVPAVITTVLVLIRIAPWIRVKSAEHSAALLWVAIGFLGSLGWSFFLHPFLFRVVTPFRATRVPARWAEIAYVGIAVLAAAGAVKLMKERRAIAALLLTLAIIDVASRVHWHHVPPSPPIYAHVRGAASLLEVPLVADGIPFLYLLEQTRHGVPLVNGTSGWETPAHEELRRLERERRYSDRFVRNAELFLVHETLLTDEQRTALAPLLAKLVFVRREGSDVLFRTLRRPAGTASAPPAVPPR
jgi:hypothetical protein